MEGHDVIPLFGEPGDARGPNEQRDANGASSQSASTIPFPMVGRPSDHAKDPSAADPGRLRTAIGDELRNERAAQQRTLADVAGDAAVSVPYLSEVERGRKDVSSELLISIADALELPLDVLLERTARRLRVGSQRSSGVQLRAA